MKSFIRAISYYLPPDKLTNEDLCSYFPETINDDYLRKLEIEERRIAAESVTPSDLAVESTKKLFTEHNIGPDEIDFILFCTQTVDYVSPTTACIIQNRLGIPTSAGALDFNLGCTGYVYGLSLAKGILETTHVKNVLLLTAETVSRYLHPEDKSVRFVFGDGAAATVISKDDNPEGYIGPFEFGSDGGGADIIIIKNGRARNPHTNTPAPEYTDSYGNKKSDDYLTMDGSAVFTFAIKTVPKLIKLLLETSKVRFDDVDLFIFHQANPQILESLRKEIKIPVEKHFTFMKTCGNTVSSTIPIALYEAIKAGKAKKGCQIMLVSFGVGLSWAGTIIKL